MKYKNVELTELLPSDWDGHPRLMLVWRNGDYMPSALRVDGYVNLEGSVYKKCEKIDTMPLGWYVNFRYI